MRTRKSQIISVMLAALIASMAFAASASAGAYKVYSCQYPDGSAAPTDGWTSWASTSPIWGSGILDNCATGGTLHALLTGTYTYTGGQAVEWRFAAGRNILSYDLWRAQAVNVNHPAYVNGISYMRSSTSGSTMDLGTLTETGAFGNYSGGVTDENKLTRNAIQVPANTTGFTIGAGCIGSSSLTCTPTANPAVGAKIYRADWVLEDNDLPTATTPTGDLVSGGEHTGIQGIQFTATDPNSGSGIYRAILEVDGQIVQSITPNDNSGKCVAKGADASMNDFGYLSPCPASTPVELNLDTRSITDGVHAIRARVLDAANNVTTVWSASTVPINNSPPTIPGGEGGICQSNCNGNGGNLTTARLVSSSATGNVRRTKYGHQMSIAQRLIDAAGTPITGAQVDVYEWVNVAGAVEKRISSLMSDGDGWVNFNPRTTANKLITFKWSASRSGVDYNATNATQLIVDGSLRMKAKKRKLKPRQRLTMTGKLYGENMPRSVPIQIQARQGKRWRVISIVNTRANGKFTWRYRFHYTSHGKFRFRALVRKSSDLSVEPAKSASVYVRVRR